MTELSPQQTRAIVARSGCVALDAIPMHDGATAFEVDCKGYPQKVELLERLAEAEADLPEIRRVAEDITAGARSDWQRATMLHAYVRDHVSFAKEKRETFSPTMRTLSIGQGDCDDSARALLALLRTFDLPARLETLPSRASGEPPTHVAAQVFHRGEWRWLETTLAARPGEHPLDAARRLGVGSRGDLGNVELPELDRAAGLALGAIVLATTVGALWWMSR